MVKRLENSMVKSCEIWHTGRGESEHYPQQIWSLDLKPSSKTANKITVSIKILKVTYPENLTFPGLIIRSPVYLPAKET